MQKVMVLTQGYKRGLFISKQGLGSVVKGESQAGIVGSTHRQTVSISLTKTTNVRTSQLENY